MGSLLNLDLLWVGLAVAGAGTLGFSIYFSDSQSDTTKSFLFFTILSIFWSVINFASARAIEPSRELWLIRLVIFFASWHAFAFLVLARQFPERKLVFRLKVLYGLIVWTVAISGLSLTPLVFKSILQVSPTVETRTGPGIALFALTIFAFVGTGIWSLTSKFIRAHGVERARLGFVLSGMGTTFFFLIFCEFVLPAFFNNPALVPYGGLFLLPFIAGTAYAIMRYKAFNPRIALYGLLTFVLATATFFDVLLSPSTTMVVFRTVELAAILFAGILLMRSMVREFELEEELKETNKRQEGLIHFIGHEVKGYLTKASNVFAMLDEGDFGELPDQAREMVQRALQDSRDGVTSVTDILKASNLKAGTTTLNKEAFDFADIVRAAAERAKQYAEQKQLTFSLRVEEGNYDYVGDKAELKDHVLRNLMDNAVNYTPAGSVTVTLSRTDQAIVVKIVDTGVGITPEDKKRLFTEGGHGRDSLRTNVHSTGYGLFIAKQVASAHGGTITAESEGTGKGSTFTLTLPVDSPAEQQ